MNTSRTRFEYLQHDTHWPRMAGEVADMPAAWHALELGQNGWELVSVVRTPTGTLSAFFKREIAQAEVPAVPEELRAGVPAVLSVPTPKKKGKA